MTNFAGCREREIFARQTVFEIVRAQVKCEQYFAIDNRSTGIIKLVRKWHDSSYIPFGCVTWEVFLAQETAQ